MAEPVDDRKPGVVARTRGTVQAARGRAERTIFWRVWERMLEIEFIDRSVALAGKAFVSFFPLIIVVAAFVPASIRADIFTSLTHRLGVRGEALQIAKDAFATSDDVRRATGILGLVLTAFFATSFTTAMQRIYLRAWRRPSQGGAGAYTRGPAWLVMFLAFMAVSGALRTAFSGAFTVAFFVLLIALNVMVWWFTAWFMLKGQVRWRVLLPTGIITAVANLIYAIYADVWMEHVVKRNAAQFGAFGVAIALVTWFTGAAVCLVVGACAGPVLAEDPGRIGTWVRGRSPDLLAPGAEPSLPAPDRELRLRDAFTPVDDGSVG